MNYTKDSIMKIGLDELQVGDKILVYCDMENGEQIVQLLHKNETKEYNQARGHVFAHAWPFGIISIKETVKKAGV